MPETIEAAEEAVESAEQAHEQAQARREALRDRVDALEEEASDLERQVREAHEAGEGFDAIEQLRQRRRSARTEADDLSGELRIVDGVVERKRQAVREAEMDLAELRLATLREEGEEVGEEVRHHLAGLADAVERMESLDNSAQRLRSVFRGEPDAETGRSRDLRQVPNTRVWPDDLKRKDRTIRQFVRDARRLIG